SNRRMAPENWLSPELVFMGLAAPDVDGLVEAVASRIAARTGVAVEPLAAACRHAFAADGYSLGRGLAIPHAETRELDRTLVTLVVTEAPVPMKTLDRRPPDIFFFVLAPARDAQQHLLLLAHVARLAQSRTLLE